MGTSGRGHGERAGRPGLRLLEAPSEPSTSLARSIRAHPSTARGGGMLLHISGDHHGRILFSRIARRWESLWLLVTDGARQGLEMAVQRRPRLVVVDSRLPDADGVETVARLRQELAGHTPIVVLGDDPTPTERARFVWAGANAYVTKPLDIAEVDRTVVELLEVASLR